LVLGLRFTTEDSYFVLDEGLDLPTERETSPQRWGVGLRKFSAFATPRSAISAVAELGRLRAHLERDKIESSYNTVNSFPETQ